MHSKVDFSGYDTGKLVYIKAVDVTDLPLELQKQIDSGKTLYSVHNPDGERLALVDDRNLAFVLARENDLTPLTVH